MVYLVDDLSLDPENLTDEAPKGFQVQFIESNALCNVTLQNRFILDQFLPAQGGVCHIIDETCCTDVLSISDNMAHVVSQRDHNSDS